MSKISLTCTDFRPLRRNTLRGFATVAITDLRMTMREVAIHQQHDKAWPQPPSRPWVKDGQLITGDDGKPKYSPLFEFDNSVVRSAFSDGVVRAVIDFAPNALEADECAA